MFSTEMFSGENMRSGERTCQGATVKSVKYLEAVKVKYNLKNDRQLALHMSMGSNTISQYMNGKRIMDEEACLAVAMTLEYDEHQTMQVMMAAGMDRAEKAGQKSLWSVFSERMAATAATALLAVGVNLFLTEGDAQAAEMRAVAHADAENINYAKYDSRPDSPQNTHTWPEHMFS